MRNRTGLRERVNNLNGYSQYGEETVILETLDALGITKGHLVDIGAGDGYTLSNTRALLDRGWTGDLYDGDPKGAKDVEKVWITKSTIQEFGMKWGRCDFLSLDLDGNDYWILEMFFAQDLIGVRLRPSLIVCEINPIFQRDEAVVMPYNKSHVWGNNTYYGMSLGACERLADKYGYTLMHLHAGINAFLLRNDHAEAHPELIRPIEYRVKHDHRPHPSNKPWTRL